VAGYTTRHDPNLLRRRVRESYHALREMVTNAGSKRFVTGPLSLVTTSPVQLGYANAYPIASGTSPDYSPLEHIARVEAYLLNRWEPLEATNSADAYSYSSQLGNQRPEAWYIYGNPQVEGFNEGTAGGAFMLAICPQHNPATQFRIWGVPAINVTSFADADGTNVTLDGPGFEWLIWDCLVKIAAKDNDSSNTYQISVGERQKAEERIMTTVSNEKHVAAPRSDIFTSGRRVRRGVYYR